ncbi:YfgM family protein [Thalassotalea aquiviva]|uniref:YfgM family protein n=1 Tax=Thalassotalea aquiviva TaxID=3242415 RepID=UPI00352AC32C
METYQTEEQQVEAIKKFWKENGNSLIAGLVIGLGGFVGWGYYQDSKLEANQQLTQQYQDVITSYATKEDGFQTEAQAFIAENSDSAYATFVAFALAKEAIDAEQYADAEKHLQQALSVAATENLKAIATLRLARVQVQLQSFDAALATLGNKLPESFQAAAEEIKGDAFLLQGKKDLARTAYLAAADAGGLEGNNTLQIKLDDLAQAN